MRITKTVIISPDHGKGQIPTISLTEKGLTIGQAGTEDDGYGEHTVYVAPFIAWEHFDEFMAMLQVAKSEKPSCGPLKPTSV
jgi:hypothetical protein